MRKVQVPYPTRCDVSATLATLCQAIVEIQPSVWRRFSLFGSSIKVRSRSPSGGDDPHVGVGGEQDHRLIFELRSYADVAEPGLMAQRQLAKASTSSWRMRKWMLWALVSEWALNLASKTGVGPVG